MASTEANTTDLTYADTLWKAADTLRGQVDAAEYKHVAGSAARTRQITIRNTV